MSEGIPLTHENHVDKKINLFQAQTTHFQIDPSLAMRCHESSPDSTPVVLRGSKTCKTTIGRGHDATVKIGKANKRVSREHVVIEHKPQMDGFELTILSPNGALIDHIIFVEGEHVPVVDGTTIEILGTKIIFQAPDDNHLAENMEDVIETPSEASLTTSLSIAAQAETKQVQRGKVDKRCKSSRQKKDDEETVISITTTEPAGISIPNVESITTSTASKKNRKNHKKSALNHIIKSTTSKLKSTALNIIKRPTTLEDEIIQVLVCTRKSTMTCADIARRLQGQHIQNVFEALSGSAMIGRVERLGKTADGSPKEDLYYYRPELDPDQERQRRYLDIGKSARKCTMKDTQYFFRIPPKLPNHKISRNKKRLSTSSNSSRQVGIGEDDDDDDTKSTSSGDVSDMEVYELFKDV
ncbi:hypothetical protein [Parasitella parasitica]|uniref:FHA domain-containing protein n=1 Tax=Parasitella parasitica TaxID=35722 RepID=A0A0B7NKZ8_9FUNG|nr:hypothetical protein [Parasitella parasitica]